MRREVPQDFMKKGVWATLAGLGALFLVGFAVLSYSPEAEAQAVKTANTLKVSPVRTDIEVLPGARKVVQVTITNLAETRVTVRPVANDFIAGDERGTAALILDEDAYAPTHSLKRFMSPLSPVTIGPKESKTINVVVSVPSTAQAGGYFGSVRFMPSNPDDGGQVNLSPSVASLVLLKVPGATVEDLRVTTFEVQKQGKAGAYFSQPDNLQLFTRFENKGNLQVAPRGKVYVQRGKDIVYEADFNVGTPADMILPDSARRWDVPLKDIGAFGRYTVTATFTYGEKNQTIELERVFWVLPLWILISVASLLLVILAGAVLLVVFIVRRRSAPGRRAPKAKKRGMQTQQSRRFGR